MNLDTIKALLPDAARDLRINLGNVLQSEHLSPRQAFGAALVSALSVGHRELVQAIRHEAGDALDDAAVQGVQTAAAIMAMNNVYYRFTHLVHDPDYATMPARLRMQGLANPGVPAVDFELWSLAVSAVNGCGKCLDAHATQIVAKGGTKAMVQDAVRIAAVIAAVASTLRATEALAPIPAA